MKKNIFLITLLIGGFTIADSSGGRIEDCLFTVEAPDGTRGSAFLMKDLDGVWMVSTCYVAAWTSPVIFTGMKSTNRTFKLPAIVEVSASGHALRFPITETEGLELASKCTEGESVCAFGNSGGMGVISKSKGVVGKKYIDEVLINCEMIVGNSGGPIIDDERKVVGIASYIADPALVEFSGIGFSSNRFEALKTDLATSPSDFPGETYWVAEPLHDVLWQEVSRDVLEKEIFLFLEKREEYFRLNEIFRYVAATRKISEYAGKPFLEKRWIRQYDENIPDSLRYELFGRGLHPQGKSWESFLREYRRKILDLHENVSMVVDEQKDFIDANFTVSAMRYELKKYLDRLSLNLERLKIIAAAMDR